MFRQSIIQPSTSPWTAPVKDNYLLLRADYRRLNAVIVIDAFPLSSMDDLLASISGNSSLPPTCPQATGRLKYFYVVRRGASVYSVPRR
ncbi:hypothetical protein AAHC03_013553 [Spirometra sp. Aus1]